MATAPDRVYKEPVRPPQPIPFRPIPIVKRARRNRTKWALIIGGVVTLAVAGELWRMHSADAIQYDTVPVERGAIPQSSRR
jgi:hypothetical protein